jgi:hypothetical protein
MSIPRSATACRGLNINSNTLLRTSAFFCCKVSLAKDFLLANLGGTGRRASSMIAIFEGLLRVFERMFPIVMYTGQAFLSPEKLVRWV